jgi:hypothetical protein
MPVILCLAVNRQLPNEPSVWWEGQRRHVECEWHIQGGAGHKASGTADLERAFHCYRNRSQRARLFDGDTILVKKAKGEGDLRVSPIPGNTDENGHRGLRWFWSCDPPAPPAMNSFPSATCA